MHEQSQTVERDGRYYNISGVTGADLEGPFPTLETAVASAKRRSAMAETPKKKRKLSDDIQEELDRLKNAPPKAPAGWGPDPYAHLIDLAAEHMDKAAKGLGTEVPWWVRGLGGLLIPQTSTELAMGAAMLPLGGPLAARGVPLAGRLAAAGLRPFLARSALTGIATGAVGALTGHDPLESGLLGAGGRLLAEPVGAGVSKIVQHQATKRLQRQLSDRL